MSRVLANALALWLLVVGTGWVALELTGGWYEYQLVPFASFAEHAGLVNTDGWEPVPGTVGVGDTQVTYYYRRPRVRLGR
jgi:hypothetical protein